MFILIKKTIISRKEDRPTNMQNKKNPSLDHLMFLLYSHPFFINQVILLFLPHMFSTCEMQTNQTLGNSCFSFLQFLNWRPSLDFLGYFFLKLVISLKIMFRIQFFFKLQYFYNHLTLLYYASSSFPLSFVIFLQKILLVCHLFTKN